MDTAVRLSNTILVTASDTTGSSGCHHQRVFASMTSPNCIEMVGILRFLISFSTTATLPATRAVQDGLLQAIMAMADAISYHHDGSTGANSNGEKPVHGPNRIKKMIGSLVGLGFHSYFQLSTRRRKAPNDDDTLLKQTLLKISTCVLTTALSLSNHGIDASSLLLIFN